MPKLRDLYGIDLNRLGGYRPEYTSVMERPLTDFEREQRSAPIDRPYASGQLEAPMFAPDDLIGSGIPTKLAALAKGSIPAIAGIFIGPKHPSWSKEAAELALQMKASNVDPRSIHKTTGTLTEFPGVEAMQELSDKGTKWSGLSFAPAEDSYPHPALFEGYPRLGRNKVSVAAGLPPSGAYYPDSGEIDATGYGVSDVGSSILHELQHAVQAEEGWPRGSSLARAKKLLANPTFDEYLQKYLNNAGETMARITQNRRDMDDMQRRMKYPFDGISLKDLWSE